MAENTNLQRLTSGSLLARNTLWNFLGQGAPLLVAVLAIPILINGLGIDRFGILSLIWRVMLNFNLLDLGMGRALIKLVAERLGGEHQEELPSLVWTALLIVLVLGLVLAVVMALLAPWLAYSVLNVPSDLQRETLYAFYLVAVAIPIIVTSPGLRGVLEAQQRFGLVNAVRTPMAIFNLLGPLLVLPFSQSLVPVVALMVLGRLGGSLVYLVLCISVTPNLGSGFTIKRAVVGPLLSFGSWITVSNIISPIMVNLDRFLIGALISAAAVAYYATPFDLVTRLWIFPAALTGVLFPAYAMSFVEDRGRALHLFSMSVKYLYLIMFPVTLILVTFAQEGLQLWLGVEFSNNSTRVLQWLAVGVLINSLAHIPSALVQGAGRPDLTAKLHLIEIPFYLLGLWWLIGAYGIEGAAIVWVLRVVLDAVVLFFMAGRLLHGGGVPIIRPTLTMAGSLVCFAGAFLLVGLVAKGIFLVGVLLTFVLAVWFLLLAPEERVLVRSYLSTVLIFKKHGVST